MSSTSWKKRRCTLFTIWASLNLCQRNMVFICYTLKWSVHLLWPLGVTWSIGWINNRVNLSSYYKLHNCRFLINSHSYDYYSRMMENKICSILDSSNSRVYRRTRTHSAYFVKPSNVSSHNLYSQFASYVSSILARNKWPAMQCNLGWRFGRNNSYGITHEKAVTLISELLKGRHNAFK